MATRDMMASPISPWITFESGGVPARPLPPLSATAEPAPSAIELDKLEFNKRYTGPGGEPSPPRIPAEVESTAVRTVQTLGSRRENKLRFAAACTMFLLMGLNDSAPGALLPYLERQYDIGYGTVSLIFIANAAGFVVAAFVTNRLNARLGRAKVLSIGMVLSTMAYIILVCTPPFGLVVASFFLSGLGNALCIALTNGWVAGLAQATVLLGLCHASYGVGGIMGPLISTTLVSVGRKWSTFYFLTLALSVFNAAALLFSFRGLESEAEAEALVQSPPQPSSPNSQSSRLRRLGGKSPKSPSSRRSTAPKASLIQALKSRVVLFGALFIFAYQGAEVDLSGWVYTLLLNRPHPAGRSASLGYVSSGFWAGITLGRIALTAPAQRIGEKTAVVLLLIFTSALQFVVWFVPNVFADAVAVAFVGLLLGPIYPCATVVFSKLMTREEMVPALSIVTALGSSGGAMGPFVTGILGQKLGVVVLNPIVEILVAWMLICWFALPRIVKRTD